MYKNKKRIELLSQKEYVDHYALPQLQKSDRALFFDLNKEEYACMKRFKHLKTQVFFILQLGYFRDKQQFFTFDLKEVKNDVKFILESHFNMSIRQAKLSGQLGRDTAREQTLCILTLCEYELWSTKQHKIMALEHLAKSLRRHPKEHNSFRAFLNFLEQNRITLPSYRVAQDLFTEAMRLEKKRLNQHLVTLSASQQAPLARLIDNEDGLSRLNAIRCDQADFNYQSLQAELNKLNDIADLYPFSQTFMPTLSLSRNAIRYYASIAEQYPAARLRKFSKTQQSLYVLCFIYHRYQEFIDNLIISFLHYVKELKVQAVKAANDAEAVYYRELALNFPALAQFLQWYASEMPNNTVTSLAFQKAGFKILAREKQERLAEYLQGNRFDKAAIEWAYYEKRARRLALYLKPILLAVPFTHHKQNSTLSQLITILREHYLARRLPKNLIAAVPTKLLEKLPKKIRPYLRNTENKTDVVKDYFSQARLEFYIYDKMAKNLDYGRLYCHDSVTFADLDDDLVDDSLVDNIKEIAEECGYPKLATYCDKRLDQAASELNNAWKQCNSNIEKNQNKGLKIKTEKDGSSSWSLTYDTSYEKSSDFFNAIEQREIAHVIKMMGVHLAIWPIFQHKLSRYIKHKQVEPTHFIAGLLAQAFGFGCEKMAERSNISLTALQAVHDDYLYVENLANANAILSDYIDQLPVSRAWDLYENERVADGDGQKFVTKFHTLQSRFSAKYYRTRRGISIYSIVANHIPINSKVIGPNEHESHFLFDVLYNNLTNIPINFITGDNHSINQLNYVATDVIDTQFIPNIKQIREEADKIYCIGDPEKYAGFLTPCGQIDLKLIKAEKRGILRILISLLLQENTQAVIIRKLSSHKRYSQLQRAFWEYNKIFKSTHILNVVNDAELRKVIKTARNRTESYRQLQRGLRKVSSGLFKGRRIVDNQMSCQATRLVANFMIAYNATLLNGVYLRLVKKYGETAAHDIIAPISPVAWPHILLTGRYHFNREKEEADFQSLISQLEVNLQKRLL